MTDPITIYRFLDSDAALKTLVAGKFRVGRLSNFNDPFEWQLGGSGTTPEERTGLDQYRKEHPAWSDSWMGILCFSDCVSDPVHWSLYAEKHQGVAFEVKYPWKDDDLHKMTYSNERPVLDFNRLREHRDVKEREEYLKTLLRDLMFRKSLGWAFEREYRMSIDINSQKHCLLLPDGWHHWLIPDNFLKRVILGFRCPLEESVIRKLLDMNGLVDTEIARAKMCSETYTIKC